MKKILSFITWIAIAVPSITYATPVFWEINTGGWAYETSWSITQLTGGSWSEGMTTGSMSNQNYTYNWDLNPGDYLLTMADTYGDGLDAGGHATLIVDGTTLLNCGVCFGSSYRLSFVVPTSDDGQVPEPITLALMGLGLAGIGYNRRKKKLVS